MAFLLTFKIFALLCLGAEKSSSNETNLKRALSPQCDPNCQACDVAGLCYKCQNDFDFNQEKKCVKISCKQLKNCLSCPNEKTCEVCRKDHFRLNGSLQDSGCERSCKIDNCIDCAIEAGMWTCKKCKDYFNINNGACEPDNKVVIDPSKKENGGVLSLLWKLYQGIIIAFGALLLLCISICYLWKCRQRIRRERALLLNQPSDTDSNSVF